MSICMPVAAPALLLPPRTPWPAGFPAVVVHTQTALRDHHPDAHQIAL